MRIVKKEPRTAGSLKLRRDYILESRCDCHNQEDSRFIFKSIGYVV